MTEHRGLVGWWPLHDEQAVDLAKGNDGSPSGVDAGVAGRGGLQATSFSPPSSVSVPDVPGVDETEFTISAWVKGQVEDESDNNYVLDWRGQFEAIIGYNSNNAPTTYSYWDGSWHSTDIQIDEQWRHVVYRYDGSTSELIIDSTVWADNSTTIAADTSSTPSIGSSHEGSSSAGWNGSICDVRVYNRALSGSEVYTLYEWGSLDIPDDPTDGVSRYALDGDATDSWGSNDGTVNGPTATDDAIRGQAYSFDSSTEDEIDMGDVLGDALTSAHTMAYWSKYESGSDYSPFVGKRDVERMWIGQDGEWDYFQTEGNDLRPVYTVPDKESWNHYALVATMSEEYFYFNGTLVNQSSIGRPTDSTEPFKLGTDNVFRYGNGKLDDVRIYDRALEPWEVFELYRWGTRGRDMRKMVVNA